MIPNITIGSREISAYLLAALVGIFVAGLFVLKMIDKSRRDQLLVILLWSSLGVLAGGHLLFGITNIPHIIAAIKEGAGLFTVLGYFGGSVFYGGLLGGLAMAVIYCRIVHVDVSQYADYGAMFIPCFHIFGRIGCFLSGCCYGMESDFGFVYHYSMIESANGVRRFPVQLVEAFGELLIFIAIVILWKKGVFKKKLISVYFVAYPILRFVLEFFRGDSYRGFLFGLSTSQIISILAFAVNAIFILLALMKKNKKAPEAKEA